MTHKRNQRALRTIRTLRMRQQHQAQKIDILCRDMVTAHTLFAQKVAQLSFAASFYETILGCSGLEETLDKVVTMIHNNIDQAGAAIFMVETSGFDVHVAKSSDNEQVEKSSFQSWFSRPMVEQISQSNHLYTLDEMLKLGLAAPPSVLRTLSATAVPLGRFGLGVGLILIYRSAEHPLLDEELSRVASIASGLRETILSFKSPTLTVK